VISGETSTYTGFETYSLHERPARSIIAVNGSVKNLPFSFKIGKDFDFDKKSNSIVWLTGGSRPDLNTELYVDYVAYTEAPDTILERLPAFYRAREKRSTFYELISGFASIMGGQERDVYRVEESHSLSSAQGIDLDLLASNVSVERKPLEADDDFRERITKSLGGVRLGGTVDAIRIQLASFLNTGPEQIIVVENPPAPKRFTHVWKGDSWEMSSEGIQDEIADLSIDLEGGELHEPILTDVEGKNRIRFMGSMKAGEKLEISGGVAKLNGKDVTTAVLLESGDQSGSLSKDIPRLSRKWSRWELEEKLTEKGGRFDKAKFDDNVFFKEVPPTKVTMEWTTRLPSMFEVRVSERIFKNSNLSIEDIQAFVNSIKAAGVQAVVTIVSDEGLHELSDALEDQPSHPSIEGRSRV
jgi:hypothetical protein